MTEQQPPDDQIGGWNFPVQICRRGMVPAMLRRQTIPQRDVVKRYLFELETLVVWRGAVGLKKRKMKSSFPFFSLSLSPVAAAADDVHQRKVTEGKMHIEKALGNIWCRRQRRLYHSSGGKKFDAEKYGWSLIRRCMYHSVRFHIKDAKAFWKSPLASAGAAQR